jgi:hypothetical protein
MLLSRAEQDYIKDKSGYMRDEDIATALSRWNGFKVDIDVVRRYRQRSGIKKKRGRSKISRV